jgi:hypothetical protein
VARLRLTQDQALEIAKAAAEAEGWPWEGPFGIWSEKTHVLVGRRVWHVYSHAGTRGENVLIRIDDTTGEVVGKRYLPR